MSGCTIYGLVDSSKPTLIRYVGQTKRSMRVRYREHIKLAYLTDFPVNRWIRKVRQSGNDVAVVILERSTEFDATEIRWIAKLKAEGAILLNATAGGMGNLDPSPETRAKLAAAKRGIPKSDEHREKLRAIQTATPSRGFLGGKHTDEAKAKFSRKGSKHTPETKALMAARQIGRKHTEETKAKIWTVRRQRALERAEAARQTYADA